MDWNNLVRVPWKRLVLTSQARVYVPSIVPILTVENLEGYSGHRYYRALAANIISGIGAETESE